MVLPELGGRIQRAFDKTNQYDFVYHNEVIKPALVGLTAGDPEYQPGFESADTRVQGVVAFYGVYDMTNRLGTRAGSRADDYRTMLERFVMKRKFAEAPELFARASPIDRLL